VKSRKSNGKVFSLFADEVYLAKDDISNKQVALKVIRKVAGVWSHPFVKQMLMEEKKIMASLQGLDWFVQLEASWHDTNNIYLAMVSSPISFVFECLIIAADVLPYRFGKRTYQV
jgi:hypothetical protein